MIDIERNNLRGLLDEALTIELLSKCLSWGKNLGPRGEQRPLGLEVGL